MKYILTKDVPPFTKGTEVDSFFAQSLNQQMPGACELIEEAKVKYVVEKKESVSKKK